MMSAKFVFFSCVTLLALSTALALKGIPDSEERAYLYNNEEAEEFWFQLGAIPDGTDMSTTSSHQELTLLSDGIGPCHADAEFRIDAGSVTATMTIQSPTGLPTGEYVYSCPGVEADKPRTLLNLESDKQTRIKLNEECDIESGPNTHIKITTVKMVLPFDCHIFLVVKGKQLSHRLDSYPPLVPPSELGMYAASNDRHPHLQFGRSTDGKRIIKIMEARYSFHEYYKGVERPIPTIEIATDDCVEFEMSFEINDVCKIQFEILPDHEFNVRVNYLEENWMNRWNAEWHVDGDANGTQIVFTKDEVLLFVVHPRLQIFHLGTCDLGPKDFRNDSFILQAWTDKRRQYTGCVVPALKFAEEVYVRRPKKRRPLSDFNWEPMEPLPQYRPQPTFWNRRNTEIAAYMLIALIGLNIIVALGYKIICRIDDHYRRLPPGRWW